MRRKAVFFDTKEPYFLREGGAVLRCEIGVRAGAVGRSGGASLSTRLAAANDAPPPPPPYPTTTSSRLVPASSSSSPAPLTNRHDSTTASKQCIAETTTGKPSRRASLQPWRTLSTPPPQRRNPPLHSGTGSARIAIPHHPQCNAHPRPSTRHNQLLPTQASAASSDSSSSTRNPTRPPLPPLHPRHSLPSDPTPPPGTRLAPRVSRLHPSRLPPPLPPPRAKLSTCSQTPTPPNRQRQKRQNGVVACSRTNSANATPTGAPPAPSTSTATRPHSHPMKMMAKRKKKTRASRPSPTPIPHPEVHPTPTPSTTPARVSSLPPNRRPPPPSNRGRQGSRSKTRVPGSNSALCSQTRSCSRARASRPLPVSLSSIAPPPPISAPPPAAAAQPQIHHFSRPAHVLPHRAPTRLPCMPPAPPPLPPASAWPPPLPTSPSTRPPTPRTHVPIATQSCHHQGRPHRRPCLRLPPRPLPRMHPHSRMPTRLAPPQGPRHPSLSTTTTPTFLVAKRCVRGATASNKKSPRPMHNNASISIRNRLHHQTAHTHMQQQHRRRHRWQCPSSVSAATRFNAHSPTTARPLPDRQGRPPPAPPSR